MATSESHVLAAILLAWGAHPRLRIARVNTGAAQIGGSFVRFGVPGTADIVGLIAPSGRMLQLETKRLKGKRRDSQLRMQKIVRAFGGVYEFVESLEEADAVLFPLVGPR